MEKNRFETWFLFVVFGFCWMIRLWWIRVPKVLSGEKTLGTLWGSIPIPIWTPSTPPPSNLFTTLSYANWFASTIYIYIYIHIVTYVYNNIYLYKNN